MAKEEWQGPLWLAVNRYIVACGGDPSAKILGNTPRMMAFLEVNNVVRAAGWAATWCIKNLLRSAVPNAQDHPTMWDAWGDASELLGEDRNAHRIPNAALPGSARAIAGPRKAGA